jgi:preprotein translocase subunit SecD
VLPAGSTCDSLVQASAADPEAQGAWVWGVEDSDGNRACYQLAVSVLSGDAVSDATYRFNQCNQGLHCVEVDFDGSSFFDAVATPLVGQNVAIVLDNVVQSAPQIGDDIQAGDSVQISGDFSEGEARDLALVLRYGSLPIKFDESKEVITNVSPTLGKDQLRAGIIAGSLGLLLVALYMGLFYRLLGLVVWLGLALTGLIMFTLITFLSDAQGVTLTLSGVTGIIVSVGVTVDSYVVYFERLKDEVRTGKTIRSSLDSGFRRAFRTILAADLVSLLGAGVLYLLAIGSVKGFAYFLAISTVIDLAIAYFIMYPLVSIMAKNERLVRTRGMGVAAGLDVAVEGAV